MPYTRFDNIPIRDRDGIYVRDFGRRVKREDGLLDDLQLDVDDLQTEIRDSRPGILVASS